MVQSHLWSRLAHRGDDLIANPVGFDIECAEKRHGDSTHANEAEQEVFRPDVGVTELARFKPCLTDRGLRGLREFDFLDGGLAATDHRLSRGSQLWQRHADGFESDGGDTVGFTRQAE